LDEDKLLKQTFMSEMTGKRRKIEGMGGSERIAGQTKKNKLTARDRINLLIEKDPFHELRACGCSRGASTAEEAPADGVITGYGKVNGRTVYVYSQDFTVQGGTLAETHANKICLCLDAAMKAGCPIIGSMIPAEPAFRTESTHWPASEQSFTAIPWLQV
jgi:propionyl-CoA carboxylase beta chain